MHSAARFRGPATCRRKFVTRGVSQIVDSGHVRKLLVIEDDGDTRALLVEHFDRVGYQVETARDGNEGITRSLQMHPDVIVLDLMMPRLDGWDTVKILRTYAATASIPVVAWTGALEDGQARALAVGCNVVVKKPCPPEDVECVIDDLLGCTPPILPEP